MNNVNLTGRATRDLELRYTPNGKAVANGSIAVQRKFKNANGDYDADFVDFVAWGKTGELMDEYIKKGEHFGISGTLQTRTWEKDDGTKVKVTEVNVSDFDFPVKPKNGSNSSGNQNRGNESSNLSNASNSGGQGYEDPFADEGKPIEINDDDLPF
ncbi:single-stranded DNA-binding protein [Pullulanibacillus camelliae]|uniref:Single-stranded DNA-binding protein n=1 Tax=Pullulanibacillus camelliae TaxID=1707096 RepID=A0A8J2YJN8_9BACL|nr:single-stranded DNA-binding protein [Pullulanibacillus camelliae]GGE47882.1 single-stranded DNA-binding protein [Pullulanibacillus camelliae]